MNVWKVRIKYLRETKSPMNLCVQFFDGSVAVEVPRTRFHPIRDTADLLLFSVRFKPCFCTQTHKGWEENFIYFGFCAYQFLSQNVMLVRKWLCRLWMYTLSFVQSDLYTVKEGIVSPNPSRLSHDNPSVELEGLKLRKVPHHRKADMLVSLDIWILLITLVITIEGRH